MIKGFFVAVIRFYQKVLSPLTVSSCRFVPSCSSYAIQALKTHGLLGGLFLTVVRILKCHPLHPGGYDPVPKKNMARF